MRRALAPLLAAVLTTGCAHSVNELARETSRAAVDESVDELTEEDSRQQIASAMTDPRIEKSVKGIVDQVTEGVLNALTSKRAQEEIAGVTSAATRAATRQLVASMSSPAVREQVQTLTRDVTRAALSDLGGSLQQGFLPGMRDALARELAEGGAAGLRNAQFSDALGATAQAVAYKAVLGVNDGLRTSWTGETGDDVRGIARAGVPWLKLGFWGLMALALCLLSCAAILIARARRASTEVRRLETATLLLATAMRERHGTEQSDEIVTVVRDALEKSAEQHQRHGLLGILRLRHH